MSSIWNVLSKTKEYAPVVTQEELDALGFGKPLKDVLRANSLNDARREETQWRQELDELTARLSGRKPLAEAEQNLAALRAEVKSLVDAAKGKIAACDKALGGKFLSNPERSELAKTRANLEEVVAAIHAGTRVRLAQAEQAVKDAEELDKLRPRWQELRQRAQSIDAAKV